VVYFKVKSRIPFEIMKQIRKFQYELQEAPLYSYHTSILCNATAVSNSSKAVAVVYHCTI
jgi:hypothetical protein